MKNIAKIEDFIIKVRIDLRGYSWAKIYGDGYYMPCSLV